MNLFENSIFSEALLRGIDATKAEQLYDELVKELHVPAFIARQVALGEIDIHYERLEKIGKLFGKHYNAEEKA